MKSHDAGSKNVSGRLLLIALAVVLIVFSITHVMKFPGSLSFYMEVTQGQKIFDMAPSFSVVEVYGRLDAMGAAGREAYRKLIFTIDFVFPVAVLFFLFNWSRYFTQTNGEQARLLSTFRLVTILPFAYFLSDMIENVMVLSMLSTYPDRILAAEVVGYFTVVKRVSMMVALIAPPLIWAGSKWGSALWPSRQAREAGEHRQ